MRRVGDAVDLAGTGAKGAFGAINGIADGGQSGARFRILQAGLTHGAAVQRNGLVAVRTRFRATHLGPSEQELIELLAHRDDMTAQPVELLAGGRHIADQGIGQFDIDDRG